MKIKYYMETTAAIGLKGGLSIQTNEFIKLNEYQNYRSLKFQNKKLFFSENVGLFGAKFHTKAYE